MATFESAALKGDIERLETLRKAGREPDTCIIERTAYRGQLGALNWLKKHYPNLTCESFVIEWLARKGDLKMLKWIKENYDPQFPPGALYEAAWKGHIHVLKWFKETYPNVKAPKGLVSYSAQSESIHIMEWIMTNYNILMTTECVNVSYDLAFPDGDWDCYVYSILYFFDDDNAFNSWNDDLWTEKELMDFLFGLFFKSCSLPLNEPLANLVPFVAC